MNLVKLSDDVKFLISKYGFDIAYKLNHIEGMSTNRPFPLRLIFNRRTDRIDFSPTLQHIGKDEITVFIENGKWHLYHYHILRGSFEDELQIQHQILKILNKNKRWDYVSVKMILKNGNCVHQTHCARSFIHVKLDEFYNEIRQFTPNQIYTYLRHFYESQPYAKLVEKCHLPNFHFADYSGSFVTILEYAQNSKSFKLTLGLNTLYDEYKLWIWKEIFDESLIDKDVNCQFLLFVDGVATQEKYTFEEAKRLLLDEYNDKYTDASNDELYQLASELKLKLKKRNLCHRFQSDIVKGMDEIRRLGQN
eukprot:NODE_280_length_10841_cov_1.006982.p2 type:complete len:307 gc:universal NODE_280_length_10841_cov_1.006982:5981-6901(+)